MACKDGWHRKASRSGGALLRAAAMFALVSVSPQPSRSEDACQVDGGQPPPSSGALIRLRPGVPPEAPSEGAGADTTAPPATDEGLVEEAGVTAAGGTTVHLRGRYRSSAVLVRGDDGSASTECIANLPLPGRSD